MEHEGLLPHSQEPATYYFHTGNKVVNMYVSKAYERVKVKLQAFFDSY